LHHLHNTFTAPWRISNPPKLHPQLPKGQVKDEERAREVREKKWSLKVLIDKSGKITSPVKKERMKRAIQKQGQILEEKFIRHSNSRLASK
jgi:hypothetical protein